jgi:hypothetical protein
VTKSVAEWGVDTAWPSFDNVRQSVANLGASNVDVVRLTFHPAHPLTDNGDGTFELSATAKGFIDNQLALATMAGSKPLALLPGEFGPVFDATHWLRTIKATQEYINSWPGFATTQIKSIEVFNEPDFWVGQGNTGDLNSLIAQLKADPEFQNTEFPAGSTLNSNNSFGWYNPVPAATQGSSHLLGGSMTSYVSLMEHLKSTGKEFVNPELHSLGGSDHRRRARNDRRHLLGRRAALSRAVRAGIGRQTPGLSRRPRSPVGGRGLSRAERRNVRFRRGSRTVRSTDLLSLRQRSGRVFQWHSGARIHAAHEAR